MPINTDTYVIELTLHGVCITEECLNVFHYASNSFLTPVATILETFRDSVLLDILQVTTVDMVYDAINVQFVRGAAYFDTLAVSETGVVGGDCLPPYASWDFTLVRGGALERNGYKRFAGVPETYQAQGLATATALSNLAVLATGLGNNLDTGLDEWEPVIKRTRVNRVAQVPPKYYSISSARYSKIGTQNSRKYGHGR